jgi:hypothetical protein
MIYSLSSAINGHVSHVRQHLLLGGLGIGGLLIWHGLEEGGSCTAANKLRGVVHYERTAHAGNITGKNPEESGEA